MQMVGARREPAVETVRPVESLAGRYSLTQKSGMHPIAFDRLKILFQRHLQHG